MHAFSYIKLPHDAAIVVQVCLPEARGSSKALSITPSNDGHTSTHPRSFG
ncbi:hypothetical protein IAE37_002816 [Pseudomonas sp. S31]|nr:hypothetical protein [Pseudomonas sp. S31]